MKLFINQTLGKLKGLSGKLASLPLPYLILYGMFYLHFIDSGIRYLYSLYHINYTFMHTNVVFRFLSLLLPVGLWIYATGLESFNFRRIKALHYILTALHEALLISSIGFELLSVIFLPSILQMRTDEVFTKGMVLFLARLITELPALLLALVLFFAFIKPLRDEKNKEIIMGFKLSHYREKRKKKDAIEYPLTIAKDVKTGKPIVVSEKDRFLHTLVDGTSGTGKTSSTILPAIKNDLNVRLFAQQKQMQTMKRLVKENKYLYTGSTDSFSIFDFTKTEIKTEDNIVEQTLDEISLSFPVCGITVLAPEDSLTDDVCRLCEARGVPYNRIDATPDAEGKRKKNWIGMNPFYLSSDLSGDDLQRAIVKKAVVFSDVMQVITDLKGKADSYFTGLNRQMISNLAILVMNTVPLLHGRQATPADLQLLINNFDLLPAYVKKLDELDRDYQRYTFVLQYIREELLGKGRVKMEDQSRGTRNIINEFLLMPGSREVYCAQKSIDFDRILKRGEITVCNYDLASGDSNAVAFGLFFLLSFNNAVLSRPGTERTRIPHFFYIDELPVLIHSSLEKNFSLFRKFRVAMFCAIQTLDQFEKNEITKYLKGVILGCAHIMVFGRSSLSDMEVFSAMAGVRDTIETQDTVTQTALSSDSPALSYSTRELSAQKNTLEECNIRMRDFQEVTYFTTKDGRPLPPYHAKVDFLKPSDWEPQYTGPVTIADFVCHEHTEKSANEPTKLDDEKLSFEVTPAATYTYSLDMEKDCPKNQPASQPVEQTDIATPPLSSKDIPSGSESLDGLF